ADLDFRVKLQKVLDLRCQPGRAEGHGGRDLQWSLRAILALAEHRLGHDELDEDLPNRVVQQLSLFGEDQASRMAMEQHHSEAVLQCVDLPADRRLTEIQGLAGMREATGLRHRMENAQLVPVHPTPAPQSRSGPRSPQVKPSFDGAVYALLAVAIRQRPRRP